jgi:hypothetical protein
MIKKTLLGLAVAAATFTMTTDTASAQRPGCYGRGYSGYSAYRPSVNPYYGSYNRAYRANYGSGYGYNSYGYGRPTVGLSIGTLGLPYSVGNRGFSSYYGNPGFGYGNGAFPRYGAYGVGGRGLSLNIGR